MVISVDEAKSLFRKWRDEKRVIHCILATCEIQSKILGRVELVEGDKVRISQAGTNMPVGDRTFLRLDLNGSTPDYSDMTHLTELVVSMMKGHDAFLTVTLASGIIVGFDVLAPLDELLDI